jgi:uncharacterized protein YbaP (TraB family)
MRWLTALIALFLIAAPFVWAAEEPVIPETATPALWKVEKGGKTLYLFGSIHLLPPQTKWKREEIDRAREASQVFVFEAPLDEGGQAMLKFVEEGGKLKNGETLKDALAPDLHADMEKAAWKVQYPPKLLAPLRPWLAAVYLELYAYLKAGFSSYYGVDHVIEQEAKAAKAEFAYFESVSEQLGYFAKLDRKTETAFLKATVRGVLDEPNLPYDLLNAWASGKTEDLAACRRWVQRRAPTSRPIDCRAQPEVVAAAAGYARLGQDAFRDRWCRTPGRTRQFDRDAACQRIQSYGALNLGFPDPSDACNKRQVAIS